MSARHKPRPKPRPQPFARARPLPGVVLPRIQAYCTKSPDKFLIPKDHQAKTHAGKVNLVALMQATGLAYTTLWPLVRHPERMHHVTLATIARLCDALTCQPGDLFVYVPSTAPYFEHPTNDVALAFEKEMGLR